MPVRADEGAPEPGSRRALIPVIPDVVERHLRARLAPDVRFIVLHAPICRRELSVEIDGVHGAR